MTHNFMRLHGHRMADGGYSIVPLAAGQKWPGEYQNGRWWPKKDWQFLALTKTPEPLIDIWSNYPGCGVGIACGGQSGVIGIDIDILDAEVAGAVRRKFEELLGPTPLERVGKAPKVLLVYRVTERMEKLSFQPIEVLAQGQQFVAYGVHPDTGLPYQWPNENPVDTPVDAIPLVTPQQVREAAQAAFALIPEELRPKRLTAASDAPHVSSKDTAPATLEAITEALAHIPNGDVPWDEWKKVLMSTFAASHGSEEAYFAFLQWSRKSAKNKDETTRHEWTSCRRSPPRSLGFGTLHYLATSHGWVPPAGLAFNVNKDTSQLDMSELDAMPIEQPATTVCEPPILTSQPAGKIEQSPTVQPAAATIASTSTPISLLETDSRAFEVEWEGDYSNAEPRQYLVKKLLPLSGLALLSGPSGAGKSFVAVDLAGSVATGAPFFGQRVKPGGTLILASEGYGTLKDRLISYRSGKYSLDRLIDSFGGKETPYISHFPIGIAPINTIDPSNVAAIVSECKAFNRECLARFGLPLRLVLIDTFAAAFSLQDENSSTEVTKAMKLLQWMADQLEVLVMPVVHHGKAEGVGVRGSSAFEASADARLTVHYAKDVDGKVSGRTVSLGKSRTDETGWIHNFALEPHVLGYDEDRDQITSCTVSDLGEPQTEEKAAKKAETSKRRESILKALDDVVGSNADAEGWVELPIIRDLFVKTEGDPSQSAEAARKMFERALIDADKAGLIETMGSRGEKKLRKTRRTLDKAPP